MDLDELVLTEYPYPIALGYRRMLDAQDWPTKTHLAVNVFDFGMRTLALGLLNRYLSRDVKEINDPKLNDLILQKMARPKSLGDWKELFFASLRAYENRRERFFIPELYDLY